MKRRFLAMLLTLALLAGAVPIALAANAPAGYYGSRLTDPAAIAFYQVLETTDFKSGGNVSVTDSAVLQLAQRYAVGDDQLIRQFGAAVDSFRYDHTEFFYVDWDMLSVKVARKSGALSVTVGTGRTDTYLRGEAADIPAQIDAYDAALEAIVAKAQAKLGADATVKDKAKAANDVVCDAVTYDFCDDADGNATEASKYIRTAYGALVNGKAVCEGYSRLYKAVLNELGVQSELVSGYYIDGEAFEPHMWNYVQSEDGKWYAVDVTMNDGHRLQMGGIPTNYEKYFWQTDEIFSVDHFEDGMVSSVEYDMPYPELHKFWLTPTSSGLFDSGYGTYGDKSGFWFSYDGKSAEELKADGLYMAFRTATTNRGAVEWSPWQSADAMGIYQEGGVVSENGKTYILMPNIAMYALEAGIFDTAEDVENKTPNGTVVSVQYSDEAVTTHLIEKMSVENPTHDPEYIAPTHVRTTQPSSLLQAWLDVSLGTQHVELTYGAPLREVGDGMVLEWGVSSYNRRDLSLESVRKYAKVENVHFDGDRTISFDFTPSKMYNHNMLFYDFTVKNMVNIIANDKDGVALPGFSIGCRYENDIACSKCFSDGRMYINSYAQPSIAMNGDLSTQGWTYEDVDEDGNKVTKKVSESQRSQMALVVTKPADSAELAEAAEGQAGAAAVQSTTYEIDLNICGKVVSIPNGSYMKLNLGIPDGFEDLAASGDVTFKLYHFKRGDDGKIDYNKTEEIACVLTPYGIIAEVSSFSPYVLVAVDNSKLPAEERDTSKGVALVCSGHGGKVTGVDPEGKASAAEPVATLAEGESVTYTLVPDAGYEVDFVRLNGTDVTFAGNTVTLTYDALESANTLEVGFVASAVKDAEDNTGDEPVTPPSAMCTVTFESNGGSAVAAAHVKENSTVEKPADPTKSGYRFDGWYADHDLTEAYDFTAHVAANITLYAKWTKLSTGGTTGGSTSRPSTRPSDLPAAPSDPPAWENPFADVAENDWYYSAVGFAAGNGLFRGTAADKFTPNGDMTRGMLATVLYRLAKEPETAAGQSFHDVADDQYYAKAVAWAAEKGIVNGYGDGLFAPGDPITRAQLATMLWRYAGSPAGAGSLESFTDGDKVDPWAVEALQWAVEQKLVNGKGGGILDPQGTATRAEVAAILMRYAQAAEK